MTKKETRIVCILLVLLAVIVSSAGTALAAEESGGLKFSVSTFTGDMSFSEIDDLKPLGAFILVFVIFAYGLSLVVAPFVSGIKTNAGTMLKNNDLRNEGHKGNIHVLAGLFMLCVALLGMAIIWNGYGPGSW